MELKCLAECCLQQSMIRLVDRDFSGFVAPALPFAKTSKLLETFFQESLANPSLPIKKSKNQLFHFDHIYDASGARQLILCSFNTPITNCIILLISSSLLRKYTKSASAHPTVVLRTGITSGRPNGTGGHSDRFSSQFNKLN